MENPLFPIGNSFTNCGFSMAMLDYQRVRSWLESPPNCIDPAVVDDLYWQPDEVRSLKNLKDPTIVIFT